MTAIRVDSSDAKQLVAQLDKTTSRALDETLAVVKKGAQNIKEDARKRVSGLAHAPAYPSSITYDVWVGFRGPQAEIGPDKSKRQGALGNILEYGTIKNSPIPHLAPALKAEEPRFLKALEDLALKALEKP